MREWVRTILAALLAFEIAPLKLYCDFTIWLECHMLQDLPDKVGAGSGAYVVEVVHLGAAPTGNALVVQGTNEKVNFPSIQICHGDATAGGSDVQEISLSGWVSDDDDCPARLKGCAGARVGRWGSQVADVYLYGERSPSHGWGKIKPRKTAESAIATKNQRVCRDKFVDMTSSFRKKAMAGLPQLIKMTSTKGPQKCEIRFPPQRYPCAFGSSIACSR